MKERAYLNLLFEEYNFLLTDSQKKFFEDYYFEDLSISEIADSYKVSRSYVSKALKNIEKKLYFYEDNLKNIKNKEKLYNILNNINNKSLKDKINKIFN